MLHADRVYEALRRFGLGEDEADKVAQEVFLRDVAGLARSEERPSSPRVCTGSRSLRLSDGARAVLLPLAEADPDGENPIVALPDSPDLRKRASRATIAFVSQRLIELAIASATHRSSAGGRATRLLRHELDRQLADPAGHCIVSPLQWSSLRPPSRRMRSCAECWYRR